ncbi:ABC transporter ATP-binding protein [Paenibacillus pinihumi]|uniref:ABC transporter ATP-binding protein n=1 Tax=Paenibacillus pinihumi TaxID=669462 RepID=UPI0003F692CD|nr:ABC transporter ATP-binding protein [Paenibacillus pinihumi]
MQEKIKLRAQRRQAFHALGRLWQKSKAYWGWYTGIVALTTVLSFVIVANAELMRRIVNAVMERDTALLMTSILFMVGVLLVETAGSFASTYLNTGLQNRSTLGLQKSLLGKMLRLRSKELSNYHTGDLLSRINDASPDAQSAINGKLIQLLGNVLQLGFLLTYLSIVNIGLTIGCLLITLVIPLLATPMSRPMRATYTSRQEARAMQDAFLMDSMQGMEVIKSYGAGKRMAERFKAKWEGYLRHHLKALALEAVFYRVNIFVYVLGLMYILGYGGYLITQGRLDVGALAAFLVAFERLSGPISNLSSIWPQLQGAVSSALRVFEITDLPEEQEGKSPGSEAKKRPDGDIEFNRVTFRYQQDSEPALREAAFIIKSGQMTAIVGESGSGKTTIASLLLGLQTPESGSVRIGGQSLAEMDMTAWRESVSYVSQEPYLFSGTIGDNIRLGKTDAQTMDVIEAAKLANLHDWISQLPEGYHTAIGELGLTLSGGERQRISIARAMLRKPRLLVLDEPTSALDSENERFVQDAIENVMAGRTVVVIAHRLSTIRGADHIIVMHEGSVAEQGTHDELLLRDSRYRSLYTAASTSRKEETA